MRSFVTREKLKVIDLFCGCGGFSYGFQQGGFEVVFGVDIWADATKTFAHNFPNAHTLTEDILDINAEFILDKANLAEAEVDVIIGGPPCQGFSVSGKRMIDDPRNALYKAFVNIVDEIRPKIFIMENVPGIMRLYGGRIKDEVLTDFATLGYNMDLRLLSSENYGVPQRRKRVFFAGINTDRIKNTLLFPFPEGSFGEGKENVITCEDAISDLDFLPIDRALGEEIEYVIPALNDYQKLMRLESKMIKNHSITIHKERTRDIISLVPDGGNYKNLPKHLQGTRKVNIAWTRMNSKKPCFTIDTGHNHHFHYKENRVPTVRESARIQSFTDVFEFIGIKTSQLKQVGNAVPPLVACALAKACEEVIRKG